MGIEALPQFLRIWEPIKKYDIVWWMVISIALVHVAGLYGMYYFFTTAKFVTIYYGYWVFLGSGTGITIGAHRYFTHRSFKATSAIRVFFMLLFTMSGENTLEMWIRDHRQHHKYSDTDADPHNAKNGFFFSHCGWLMVPKHPDVKEKGKTLDLSDAINDPVVQFNKKYYLLLYLAVNAFVVLIPCLLWNEDFWAAFWGVYVLRTVLVYNCSWSVNSLAHLYGTRPYNRDIQPVDNDFVGRITYGEGWHNYHHVFPSDYRASEFGHRHDLGTRFIDCLHRLGLAYDLKETPQSVVDKWAKKFGDGSATVREFSQTNKSG